jgi:UDP-glucose 4-epimerase
MAFTRFCKAILEGEAIEIYGDGEQVRDFTYIDDVVSVTRTAAASTQCVGNVYNIGGGVRSTLRHTLDLLQEIAGRPVEVMYSAPQAGDVRATGADTGRAAHDLGFTPGTALRDGLSAQFGWALAERSHV